MATVVHQELVLLGRVTKPHGIRGEVKVFPYSGEPEGLLQYKEVLLSADQNSSPLRYRVQRTRVQKKSVLFQLENCTSRNQAEELKDFEMYVEEDQLPELGEDDYYLRELEGRLMITEQGQVIGQIHGIMLCSGQNIARVRSEKGEQYLIPLVPQFIVSIEEDEVRVSLPPGLLEINCK